MIIHAEKLAFNTPLIFLTGYCRKEEQTQKSSARSHAIRITARHNSVGTFNDQHWVCPRSIKVSLRSLYALRHARDFRYQALPLFSRATLKKLGVAWHVRLALRGICTDFSFSRKHGLARSTKATSHGHHTCTRFCFSSLRSCCM